MTTHPVLFLPGNSQGTEDLLWARVLESQESDTLSELNNNYVPLEAHKSDLRFLQIV